MAISGLAFCINIFSVLLISNAELSDSMTQAKSVVSDAIGKRHIENW